MSHNNGHKPTNPIVRALHRRMARVEMAPTPKGKTYSARVVKVESVQSGNMEMAFVLFLEVRTPHEYRGKALAHAIRFDPDRPATFKAGIAEFERCGLTPEEMLRAPIPTLLTGRTLRFRYTPPTAPERVDYRIEIEGCAWDGTPGKPTEQREGK